MNQQAIQWSDKIHRLIVSPRISIQVRHECILVNPADWTEYAEGLGGDPAVLTMWDRRVLRSPDISRGEVLMVLPQNSDTPHH